MNNWLNTRDAARHVGYTPDPALPLSKDPQVRCFYAWCLSRGIRQQPGRAVYARADLDAAVTGQSAATTAALERMRQLARQDVADRRRRGRLALRMTAQKGHPA